MNLINPRLKALLAAESRIDGLAAAQIVNALNEFITPAVVKRFKVPTTVVSGDPIIIGATPGDPVAGMAGVAQTSYDSRDGMATISFEGSHTLTVTDQWGCPQVSNALFPCQPLFAAIYEAGAVYDAVTGCWTGFKIDGNTGGIPFGNFWDTAKTAGSGSQKSTVRLKVGGGNA